MKRAKTKKLTKKGSDHKEKKHIGKRKQNVISKGSNYTKNTYIKKKK